MLGILGTNIVIWLINNTKKKIILFILSAVDLRNLLFFN